MMIKGRRRCLAILLVAALLTLSFSQGFGRRVKTVRYHGRREPHQPLDQEKSNGDNKSSSQVAGRKGLNDYDDPTPNTNPRNGAVFIPPPSPPAPPLH